MIQKVKTVKEWLNRDGNQFEIIDVYRDTPYQIKMVRRLNDGIPFLRFAPWDYGVYDGTTDTFYVVDFMPDMKTVSYELILGVDKKEGYCEINDIILDEENPGTVLFIGKKVKPWKK